MAEIQSKMQLRIINNIPPSQCTKDYNRPSITSKGQYSYRYYKITIRVTYNHSHLHPPPLFSSTLKFWKKNDPEIQTFQRLPGLMQ